MYLNKKQMYDSVITREENASEDWNCIISGCFRDRIRVPRIENRVPKIRENGVPRIREIGSLQVHTGYLTFP